MSPDEGYISVYQGAIFMYGILAANLFLFYPGLLAESGGPAAWQVALVMTAISLLLFLPMVALVGRFPGKSFAVVSELVAGPVLGPLLTLALTTWLILSVAITARNFTESVLAAILPNTPPSVLMTVLVIGVVYASYRGLEALVRTSHVLFIVLIMGVFLVLGLSLRNADPALLYPFWGYSLARTMAGGAWWSSMSVEVVALLIIGGNFRDVKSFRNSGFMGILLFGLTAAVTVATLVMTFSASDTAQLPFPMFSLARLVDLGRFFQRIESIMVLFWILAVAIRLSGLFHATVLAVTESLRLPDYRPVNFPMAIVIIALAFVPGDLVQVLRIDRDWLRPTGLLVYVVPILLLAIAIVRKQGGKAHGS